MTFDRANVLHAPGASRFAARPGHALGHAAYFTGMVLALAWLYGLAMLLFTVPADQQYYVTEKTWPGAVQYLLAITAMALLMFPVLALTPKLVLYRFDERRWMRAVAVLAIGINVAYAMTVDPDARFTEGAVYESLPIYLLKSFGNFLFMLLAIRYRATSAPDAPRHVARAGRIMVVLWSLSYLLVIDGLAPALTLCCFWACWVRGGRYLSMLLLGALAAGLLALGLQAKFGAEREVEAATLAQWAVHRSVINEEQLYTAINDDRFGGVLEHWLLVADQGRWALGKLTGDQPAATGFKSFSEYLYYQLYGRRESGSSPGPFLAAFLLGGWPLAWLVLWLALLPSYLYVASMPQRFGLIRMACLLFVLKPAYANLPGVLAVASVSFIYFVATLAIGVGRSK